MAGDILNVLSQHNNHTALDVAQQRAAVENTITHNTLI